MGLGVPRLWFCVCTQVIKSVINLYVMYVDEEILQSGLKKRGRSFDL